MTTSLAHTLLTEWKSESTQTRKMLARVPQDKLDWVPHAKSMALGKLAMHIGFSVSTFGPAILEHEVYAWSGTKAPEPVSVQAILDQFDAGSAAVERLLEKATDAELAKTWIFGTKEKPFYTAPRSGAARGFLFSHMIHHRGQLSVYLRLLDIPVPGMYGPSADEK